MEDRAGRATATHAGHAAGREQAHPLRCGVRPVAFSRCADWANRTDARVEREPRALQAGVGPVVAGARRGRRVRLHDRTCTHPAQARGRGARVDGAERDPRACGVATRQRGRAEVDVPQVERAERTTQRTHVRGRRVELPHERLCRRVRAAPRLTRRRSHRREHVRQRVIVAVADVPSVADRGRPSHGANGHAVVEQLRLRRERTSRHRVGNGHRVRVARVAARAPCDHRPGRGALRRLIPHHCRARSRCSTRGQSGAVDDAHSRLDRRQRSGRRADVNRGRRTAANRDDRANVDLHASRDGERAKSAAAVVVDHVHGSARVPDAHAVRRRAVSAECAQFTASGGRDPLADSRDREVCAGRPCRAVVGVGDRLSERRRQRQRAVSG